MSEAAKTATVLARPDAERILDGVLDLARTTPLDSDARALAEHFLTTLSQLFPGRQFAIRLTDARGEEIALPKGARGAPPDLVIPLPSLGAIEVRYPAGVSAPPDDQPLLDRIGGFLATLAAKSRLHHETELLKDYLTKLIDNADALIVGVDPDWRITVYNQAMTRLTGWAGDEVLGSDLRQWLPQAARGHVIASFARALTGRTAEALDVELTTKEGHAVRTVWNVAAIIGARQNVEAVVAIGQDVTRLKSLEKQVIQAEKLATLGQLAAGVVHELNNPLTSIIVYADYLYRKLDHASQGTSDAAKLRRILDGAERILNFSRNLVQYAKPSSEHLDVVSLNDVVRQSLSFCEHLVKREGVELSVDLSVELTPLYAVRGQLQQVVINLVTNAVHALPEGRGRVKVETRQIDVRHVALAVEDTGGGIRAEDVARIFDPFFTTKPAGKGTGLGLSIVRNIVDEHRGTIEVESAPGRGARFLIVLPTGH
jgi:two-component system, NtrC family, sensor kinase